MQTYLKLGPLVGGTVPGEVGRDEPDVRIRRVALDLLHLREDELEDSREQVDHG